MTSRAFFDFSRHLGVFCAKRSLAVEGIVASFGIEFSIFGRKFSLQAQYQKMDSAKDKNKAVDSVQNAKPVLPDVGVAGQDAVSLPSVDKNEASDSVQNAEPVLSDDDNAEPVVLSEDEIARSIKKIREAIAEDHRLTVESRKRTQAVIRSLYL